jgi:hypothetical protein
MRRRCKGGCPFELLRTYECLLKEGRARRCQFGAASIPNEQWKAELPL